MLLKNPVTPPGIDPGTVQLVAQHLNHYTTPGPQNDKEKLYYNTFVCKKLAFLDKKALKYVLISN
jgi:hypothetical protein